MNNGSISDRFVWLGDNLLALEKDGVAYNYIADGNKNITQLVNLTTGEIANKYDYSPFGQLAKTDENVENVFKFSSEYAEAETGLMLLQPKHRKMDQQRPNRRIWKLEYLQLCLQ
ncbi:hypothetical protein AAEX28_15470 [Lentisphaerota bacterium WC36G]|nr:hypothetical protein LJT99_02225 [Lentisphaerae bacterium WC36]